MVNFYYHIFLLIDIIHWGAYQLKSLPKNILTIKKIEFDFLNFKITFNLVLKTITQFVIESLYAENKLKNYLKV